MLTPFPHQISGAQFLASRTTALLADEPRVGKTGTAIIAADLVGAANILVITTASGRPVWRRAWPQWSIYSRHPPEIVGWSELTNPKRLGELMAVNWSLVILDESHYAKNPEAKRTQAAYAVAKRAGRVWCLTGTPIPNAPNDLWPMMSNLCPDRLTGSFYDQPGMDSYDEFMQRFCIVRMKKISNWNRIPVVIGGRNLDELRCRLGSFMLRRTQTEVGIREPIYETWPVRGGKAETADADRLTDMDKVLAAANNGSTRDLEMELGPIRRFTGVIKARLIADAIAEDIEGGLDKVVVMAWHRDTINALHVNLAAHGTVVLDGSTSPADRAEAERRFREDPTCRVFIGQIQAAGEAIDLSAAALLIFVEPSFTPKDMKQAALRITNHNQTRQAIVRVAVLEGSIDEAIQETLLRKWTAIREVLT